MDQIEASIQETISASLYSLEANLSSKEFITSLTKAAHLLKTTSNRIITTGMGKSGLVARKVAATLTSTGSPAVFLHPADALHGDMGNIQNKEVVLAFSNSGETRELIELLPHIKTLGGKLVAVTQKNESTLVREADAAIIFQLAKEGCPLNLAPMASTTMSMVIGDALSSALIKLRKFKARDFGRFHPSGALGRKVLAHVGDVMRKGVKNYTVKRETGFKEILSTMVSSNMGAILVTGIQGHLRGMITDGDLKRLFDSYENRLPELFSKTAQDLMTENPVSITTNVLVEEALALMHEKNTYILPVVNQQKKPVGLLRMHEVVQFT